MRKFMDSTWNPLPYEKFESTSYLLQRICQILGKLKLHTPFEPHWANVALSLTATGVTTGIIPYGNNVVFSIDINFFEHKIEFKTSQGDFQNLKIESNSVAEYFKQINLILNELNVDIAIYPMPQEVTNPIAFDEDHQIRKYDADLATVWWQILLKVYSIMLKYHSRFDGESPPIGLMWGTFDLRDARYNGIHVPTTGINAGYIRRNAMDEAQIEIGFWPGNEIYKKAAFYSFTHPQPEGIENVRVKPSYARWDNKLKEFILDYDDLIKSNQPENDLLNFFESTYLAGSELAGWDPKLITKGVPI